MTATSANRRRTRRLTIAAVTLMIALAAVGLWVFEAAGIAGSEATISPLAQGLLAAAWTAYVLAVFFRRPAEVSDR